MKKAVIVAGGTDIMHSNMLYNLRDVSYIVCADSGYDNCRKMCISPDIIIGDMDSVQDFPDDLPFLRVPAEKDFTDTHLCIDFLAEKGYRNITLLCALGGRSDHMFANMMLLGYAFEKGINLTIKNDLESIFICDLSARLHIADGKTFSLFSINGNCDGISISGAKYPLENASLSMFDTLGISNEIIDSYAEIAVKSGRLMIIQTKT